MLENGKDKLVDGCLLTWWPNAYRVSKDAD